VFEWLWEARKGFPRLFECVGVFLLLFFSWVLMLLRSSRLLQIEGTRGVFWLAYPKPSLLLKWALVSFEHVCCCLMAPESG